MKRDGAVGMGTGRLCALQENDVAVTMAERPGPTTVRGFTTTGSRHR